MQAAEPHPSSHNERQSSSAAHSLHALRPQRQEDKVAGAHVLHAAEKQRGASQIEKLFEAQPAHCVSPHETQILKSFKVTQSVHERASQRTQQMSPTLSQEGSPMVQNSRCCAITCETKTNENSPWSAGEK
jgi:hypothetical protein